MTTRKNRTGRQLLATAFIGSMLFLSACTSSEGDASADDATPSASAEAGAAETTAAPDLDLEGVPDVVAVVNGTEIDRELFTEALESQYPQAAAQAEALGQEVDLELLKTTVADNLVSSELLRQEAERRGIEVTDEGRAAAIDELLEASQLGSEEELKAAFAEQGLEGEKFDSQLADQVLIDALVTDEAGDVAPTDEEVQAAYDDAVAQQEASGETTTPIPPLDDVRTQIETELTNGNISEATQALLARLRAEGDITVNL